MLTCQLKMASKTFIILFSTCNFVGNHAFVGGDLYVTIYGSKTPQETENVTVEIRDSL